MIRWRGDNNNNMRIMELNYGKILLFLHESIKSDIASLQHWNGTFFKTLRVINKLLIEIKLGNLTSQTDH